MTLLPYPQRPRDRHLLGRRIASALCHYLGHRHHLQAAERMELAFVIEFVDRSLILPLSVWLLWQQHGVADLLLVVVIAQGIGMVLALCRVVSVTGPLARPSDLHPHLPFAGAHGARGVVPSLASA